MSDGQLTNRRWSGMRAFVLLILLIGVYLVSAFVGTDGLGGQTVNLLTLGVVILGVRIGVRNSRVRLRITALILGLFLLSIVVHAFAPGRSYLWDSIVVLVVSFLMFIVLFNVVMRREPVTADKIAAAACVYLLMGICWGYAYSVLFEFEPAAFNLSAADQLAPAAALIHFSFTTLTTVGYGNISPITDSARALSDIESVLAQLYLTIVVARLVSLQVAVAPSADD